MRPDPFATSSPGPWGEAPNAPPGSPGCARPMSQSVLKRGLSRLEMNKMLDSRMLELRVVQKLKQQLDCPQRRRRLNLGFPRPKSRLLNTGNPTTTNRPQLRINNLMQTLTQLISRLLVQPHNRIRMSSHISTRHETVTYHQTPGRGVQVRKL